MAEDAITTGVKLYWRDQEGVERLDRDVMGEGEREITPEMLGELAEIRDEMYEGSKR